MKKFLPLLLSLAILCSCGEDRTYEYEEKTACGHWMQEALQTSYLWGDSISDLEWKYYFGDPTTIFDRLIAQAPVTDSWSWCAIDTVSEDYHQRGYFDHLDSYGLDFVVMTDPTGGTNRQYARITSVFAGSPAERCGLVRGDFIGMIDGARFTSSNTGSLVNGKSHQLVVSKLGIDSDESAFVWTSTDTITIERSEYVEDAAFPVDSIYQTDSHKVGYLMCNRLTPGATEKSAETQEYKTQLASIMSKMKAGGADVLVLDLRLCNDGTLEMAQYLASFLVAGAATSDDVFAKTLYRDDLSAQNENICFLSGPLGCGLSLSQLVVITSGYTQGAAEWVIRGVYAQMGEDFISLIGDQTAGQNVMTGTIPSAYEVTLHPAVAYVANASGDYDYADGLEPNADFDEFSYMSLFPYGDTREVILSTILSLF